MSKREIINKLVVRGKTSKFVFLNKAEKKVTIVRVTGEYGGPRYRDSIIYQKAGDTIVSKTRTGIRKTKLVTVLKMVEKGQYFITGGVRTDLESIKFEIEMLFTQETEKMTAGQRALRWKVNKCVKCNCSGCKDLSVCTKRVQEHLKRKV